MASWGHPVEVGLHCWGQFLIPKDQIFGSVFCLAISPDSSVFANFMYVSA